MIYKGPLTFTSPKLIKLTYVDRHRAIIITILLISDNMMMRACGEISAIVIILETINNRGVSPVKEEEEMSSACSVCGQVSYSKL